MSTHRSTRGRKRALLSLALVGFVASGLSVQGTFAAFTDQATMETGPFTTGTLDITLDGNLAGMANNGGTWTNTSFGLSALLPGESQAVSFPVRNNGTAPLKYTLTATGSGALATTNGMEFAVYYGVPATNAGLAAAGNRVGTCGGNTPNDSQGTTVTVTPATFPASTDRALAVGAQETICIVGRLDSQAPNALQGNSMTARFVFDARQPTA